MQTIAENRVGPQPSLYERINERAALAKAEHAARLNVLTRQALQRQKLAVQDRDQADWWKHAHYWFGGAEGVIARPTENLAFSSMIDTLLPAREEESVTIFVLPVAPSKPLPTIIPVAQLAERRAAKKAVHAPAVPDWSKASVPDLKASRHRKKIASRLELL
jgi:hypothetical protein